jgi:hypothetical protein
MNAPALDAAQMMALMTSADGGRLSERSWREFREKGGATIEDLRDLDDDAFDRVVKTCERPAPHNGNPVAPFIIPAVASLRMKWMLKCARYYAQVDVTPTEDNLSWSVVSQFKDELEALNDAKSKDEGTVPKFSKHQSVAKWLESFGLHLSSTYSVRGMNLRGVIRQVADPPAPVLAQGRPYSEEAGSIETMLELHAPHTSALFKQENATVFRLANEALSNTQYIHTIAPFRRAADGHGAVASLIANHAGKAHWDKVATENEAILTERTWTGTGNTSLEQHTNLLRKAHALLVEAALHIKLTVPSESSRVKTLIKSCEPCKDAKFLAAVANVEKDDVMNDDFESTVAYLKPSCPVSNKKKKTKVTFQGDVGSIAADAGVDSPADGSKMGRTGVPLKWVAKHVWRK